MRNGDANSAVRILPADGIAPIDAMPPGPPEPRKWFVPLLVVAGVLGVFVIATRPTDSGPTAATTPPARIADVDIELIDLRTTNAVPTTNEFFAAPLGSGGVVNDLIRTTSSFVAVGSTTDGAQAWHSGTGSTWNEVPRLEVPDTAKASIDHAVYWDGEIIAPGSVDDGIGLWIGTTVSAWTYHGHVETMGMNWIHDLAAGPGLLAIAETEAGYRGWTSDDGAEWTDLGNLGIFDQIHIHRITGNSLWYFAFGQEVCDQPNCDGVILRSADGRNWERTTGSYRDNLSTTGSMITDIAPANDGLLAVGWVVSGDDVTAHIWQSSDGADWVDVPTATPVRPPQPVTIEVVSTNLEPSPWAQIRIGTNSVDVSVGSTVETDVGHFEVTGVTDGGVELTGGADTQVSIDIGDTTTIRAAPDPRAIAAEGPRIVITGHLSSTLTTSDVAWLSMDGGVTWSVEHFSGQPGNLVAGIRGPNIVVARGAGDAAEMWHSTWHTDSIAALGEGLVADYINALGGYDAAALTALLPPREAGPMSPRFMVPSLGEHLQPWWDETTGLPDLPRVVDSMDYLRATDTSIHLGDCTSGVSLGTVDRTKVRCGFTVESALLSTFGIADNTSQAVGEVRAGLLVSIEIDNAPSQRLWSILSNVIDPTAAFDGDAAPDHIAIAKRFDAGILRPGTTRTIATSAGTMEWSWSDLKLDVDRIGSISWSESGFVAVGYNDSNTGSATSVLTSLDGIEWTVVPVPERIEGIWELEPFGDGVIGHAWHSGKAELVFFDGTNWTEIPLAAPTDDTHHDFTRIAVSGDRAMAVTGWWGEGGPQLEEALLIESDLSIRTVALPPHESWGQSDVELAGSDEGFLLGTTANSALTIWHTEDGRGWTLISDTNPLDDAQYVWNLQQHRSQYFVVGDGAELRCSSQSEQRSCVSLAGLWTSPDGVAWDRVITTSGEPVSTYEIGSGPLGLVAFGQESFDSTYPRSVYLSEDGTTWTTMGDLSLLNADAQWWWVQRPAVSHETVIAVGLTQSETGSEEPFLIIGRLVEG